MHKAQIYIKKQKKTKKITLMWGGGGCRLSTEGVNTTPRGGVKISLSGGLPCYISLIEYGPTGEFHYSCSLSNRPIEGCLGFD